MKQVGCRDMGINCNFVANGKSDDEIKKNLWAHAEKAHAEVIKSLTPEKKELTAKMDAVLIRSAVPTAR